MENNHDDLYWQKRSLRNWIYLFFQIILGLPKTIIFNFFYFGLRGYRLPVLLSYKVKLKKMSGKVEVFNLKKTACVKLGFTTSEMFDNHKESFLWINDGKIVFGVNVGIRNGVVIRNYGFLEFGNEFHMSSPSKIICYKHIKFGDDILIGWNCEFSDGDAHKIYSLNDETKRLNKDLEIIIGNHVWFCANVQVHKGVKIGNNIVVAANTVLLKSYEGDHLVLGGYPVRCLRENIVWKV